MKNKTWETKEYYQCSKNASCLSVSHPSILKLKKLAQSCKSILEVGCGEGSKLYFIKPAYGQGVGVDISQTAIKIAQKQYPSLKLLIADAALLPFGKNSFNLVFSAFAIEHIDDPEKVISEMIRVTKVGGLVAILAPNYGAPQRCSPCYQGNRVSKLLTGIISDIIRLFITSPTTLDWHKVKPIKGKYSLDSDTTIEPYLGSLKSYLIREKLTVIDCSSNWTIEEASENFINKAFRYLGLSSLYPFINWGPHLFIVAKKEV